MAFGADAHSCLGSTLARLEGEIAIGSLLERFPHLRMTGSTADWGSNFAFRGLRSLPAGLEVKLLDQLVKDNDPRKPERKTVTDYLTKIARLGGYLARKKDPPPGNMVMWRGLARLTDIELGYILANGSVDS